MTVPLVDKQYAIVYLSKGKWEIKCVRNNQREGRQEKRERGEHETWRCLIKLQLAKLHFPIRASVYLTDSQDGYVRKQISCYPLHIKHELHAPACVMK